MGISKNPCTVIASKAKQSITHCFHSALLDRHVASRLAMTVFRSSRMLTTFIHCYSENTVDQPPIRADHVPKTPPSK